MLSPRFSIALPVALAIASSVAAAPARGQGRGGHASTGARARSSFRVGSDGFGRSGRGRFFNGAGFFYPPFFYDDELDYGEPVSVPVPYAVPQPAPAPVPEPIPPEPVVLENRGGQWVKIPTATEMASNPQSTNAGAFSSTSVQPGGTSLTPAPAAAAVPLPAVILVFRDGHMEEIPKYMIQGDTLYTREDYWSTGAWTRKIPLAALDIPASLKLNKERGAKFNLPGSPNEVVIRF